MVLSPGHTPSGCRDEVIAVGFCILCHNHNNPSPEDLGSAQPATEADKSSVIPLSTAGSVHSTIAMPAYVLNNKTVNA